MSPSEIEKQNQELDRKLQSEKVNLDADTVMIPDLVRERLDAFYTQMESDGGRYPSLLPYIDRAKISPGNRNCRCFCGCH